MENDFFFKILFEAIEEGNSLSLNNSDDKEELFHFSSRFFFFDRKRERIIIDIPSSVDDQKTIKVHDNVEVFFIAKGHRLGFFAKVLQFTQFKLSEDKIVPAVEISKPDAGMDLQRRRDFRVPTPYLKVIAHYSVEDPDDPSIRIDRHTPCHSDNISRSGIALTDDINSGEKLNPKRGDEIDMDIFIDNNPLKFSGTVISTREMFEGKKNIIGIDFTENKPDLLQYKRNTAILIRYIMKQQREMMLKV